MVFRIIITALLGVGLSSLLCRGSYKGDYPSLAVSIIGILLIFVFGVWGTIMLIRYGLRKKHDPASTSFVIAVLVTTLFWVSLLC